MYGDQCGEFLDVYLDLKGYITDTKYSNLYFFCVGIIQSPFFYLISVPSNKKQLIRNFDLMGAKQGFISGAPNENIVQNHLNIALLNVF